MSSSALFALCIVSIFVVSAIAAHMHKSYKKKQVKALERQRKQDLIKSLIALQKKKERKSNRKI